MSKVTVGIVLPYLKSRGTEKQALRLASGFVDRGVIVILFVVQGWGQESLYRDFRNAGVTVVNAGPPLKEGVKSVSFRRLLPLAWLVRKYRCDVLLSRAGLTNRLAGFAGRLALVPVAVVLSGSVPRKTPSTLFFKRVFSAIWTAGDLGFPWRVISVSKEGAERFSTYHPSLAKRIVWIPNGIEEPKLSAREKDAILDPAHLYFCFSGSLEIQRKGLDVLIKALVLVVRKHGLEQVSVLLIGTGEDEEKIKTLAKEENLDHYVIFAGERANPFDLMAQCEAFVLPSRREGLPNALLEAMALGLCVIASDCDTGPREIVTHEEDGLLVPSEDVGAMAEAMARVVRDSTLRQKLGVRAKKTIQEQFSYQKMVNSYYELLKSSKN